MVMLLEVLLSKTGVETVAPAALIMIIDKTFSSFPAALLALTVKLKLPAAVGVPEITPFVDSSNPLGKLPPCNDHVIGVSPVAARVWLYAVLTVPLGKVVVVIVGGTGAVVTLTVNGFVKFTPKSVPFVMVANMVAVPSAVVLKMLPVMVAPVVPALCTLHVMVWLVALLGTTVPVNSNGVPAVAALGTPVMSVTGIIVVAMSGDEAAPAK